MRRRDFVALFGSAAAWPIRTRAERAEPQRRIGMLLSFSENDTEGQHRIAAFKDELQKLGWAAGRDLQIDIRWGAADVTRMQALARELTTLGPDVMLAWGNLALDLSRQAFTGPIVFVVVVDPIGHGFIKSFAHPGGNITGFTNVEFDLDGKWLGLLKEIAPRVMRVGLIGDPETIPYAGHLRSTEAAARSLEVKLVSAPVRNVTELENAISTVGRNADGGLIILPDSFTGVHRDLIVALAAQYSLPAIYPYRFFVGNAGLMSYGVDQIVQMRQAASYIDRILKGTAPSELPVQQPTKYELVINLKTAKALGLTVPPTLLAQAEAVIE